MSWTDERIATLKKMWEGGATASQIADELGGVSRNAVIGKAHRLDLKARPSPVKAKDEQPAPTKPAAKPVARKEAARPAARPEAPPATRADSPAEGTNSPLPPPPDPRKTQRRQREHPDD